MAEGADRTRALDHLYRGQSNDCYWHGLFGGIYIGHMRLATYEHLIAAEDLAETDAGRLHAAERRDLDLDGHDEVRLAGPGQVVTIDLAEGAGIGGWDIRPVRHDVCAVMRRRPEAYHQTLRDHDEPEANPEPARGRGGRAGLDPRDLPGQGAGPRGEAPLRPVRAPLRAGPVPGARHDPEAWATADAVELGDAVEGAYEIETLELGPARRAARRLGVDRPGRRDRGGAGGQDVHPRRRSPVADPDRDGHGHEPVGATVEAILGLEWTVTMLGGGGNPAAWLEIDGARTATTPHGQRPGQTGLAQGNDTIGIAIKTEDLAGRPMSGVRRSRRSRTPRPASSASTRAPGCS